MTNKSSGVYHSRFLNCRFCLDRRRIKFGNCTSQRQWPAVNAYSSKWGLQDLNLCRRSQRIYSPPPLTTRANPPKKSRISCVTCCRFAQLFVIGPFLDDGLILAFLYEKSQRRDSNPRPADYKSAALPTELRWQVVLSQGLATCDQVAVWALA